MSSTIMYLILIKNLVFFEIFVYFCIKILSLDVSFNRKTDWRGRSRLDFLGVKNIGGLIMEC